MNLTNKRILITRPRAQAEEFASTLSAAGAHPIFFPVIEIAPLNDFSGLDAALLKIDTYDWLILTSVHGVDAFFKRLDTLGIKHVPENLRVAAIGPKTSSCLSQHGVTPRFVPTEYIAEAILSGLGEDISGKRFLLPQSDLARTALANAIRSAGGVVDEIVAYRTVPSQPDVSGMNALRIGVDIVTFTSPSAVHNFVTIVRNNELDPINLPGTPLFACIGPVTKKAAEEVGFCDLVVANQHTTAGLIEVIGKLVHS
jgi:uroporphyrinogen III methyltransferase / synthase